jgi:GT2 family glycosyltransferase
LKNMGYKVMYCAESEVFHVGGGTLNTENPFKTYLNFRNNLLLLKKNLPYWRSVYVIGIRYWMDLMALLRFINEGKKKDAGAVSKAHVNFLRNVFKREHVKITSGRAKLKGMYKRSIVLDFFVKKKHIFTKLDPKDFF